MVFSTFYFSGTGNTKWAAEQFSSYAVQNGHRAVIISITDDALSDADILKTIKESDFIGFANPIYGADIPPVMRAFIDRLVTALKNEDITLSRPVYIINTFGYLNAFGPNRMKKLFSGTYLDMTAYVNIKLCNNASTPVLAAANVNKEKLQRRKAKAQKLLSSLFASLMSGGKSIGGKGLYLIPGGIIRRAFGNSIKNNYKSMGVNRETCQKCLLCVRNCPTHSISPGNFVFSSSCTACMRCYNFCPTASITIDKIYADPRKYHRYHGPESL